MTPKGTRQVERVKIQLDCYWGLTDDCPRNGKLTSLSVRGCFIRTKAEAMVGQALSLKCWLPARQEFLLLHGKAIYHLQKVGIGVAFTDLTGEQEEAVRGLVETHRSDKD